MFIRIFCYIHRIAKRLLHRPITGVKTKFFYVYTKKKRNDIISLKSSAGMLINGDDLVTYSLFYGENTVDGGVIDFSDDFVADSVVSDDCYYETKYVKAWSNLLKRAIVPDGWRNSGFLQTGYIHEEKRWCLSSWIWTSAATARYYALKNQINSCMIIADAFLREQLICGGWIVRYDFNEGRTDKVVAPNDSAYIATNALISAYLLTSQRKYFDAAIRCANWIIETARPDGIVYIAVNPDSGEAKKDFNIVDIGFTVALFVSIFNIDNNPRYLLFSEKFVNRYVELFFNHTENAFYTALDKYDRPTGGYFARGQAWALEGMISFYKVSTTRKIGEVIHRLADYLVNKQNKDGSWAYNFSKPLMGNDCKGTPVIAKNLLDVYSLFPEEAYLNAAKRALKWCEMHTVINGIEEGCIKSYSLEGAVVHHLYSSTSFVYSTAYALELMERIKLIHA